MKSWPVLVGFWFEAETPRFPWPGTTDFALHGEVIRAVEWQ
jgi:hypothetical protein